jgi:hypothetical protein
LETTSTPILDTDVVRRSFSKRRSTALTINVRSLLPPGDWPMSAPPNLTKNMSFVVAKDDCLLNEQPLEPLKYIKKTVTKSGRALPSRWRDGRRDTIPTHLQEEIDIVIGMHSFDCPETMVLVN